MNKRSISRLIAFAVAVLTILPFCAFGVSAEKTVKADGINAFRDSGQLIIYTAAYGATTGTNEWGYEVVIEDDRCVKSGGANNAIPAGGFVLSGHNEDEGGKQMGNWLKNNIQVGSYVYYDEVSLTVTVSDKPVEKSSFYSVKTEYNGVNCQRNENFIVIYDKVGTRTGTNEFGYEVVVKEGFVSSLGGNNNLVPASYGSFVVSAHGTSIDWLKRNVRVGMQVKYKDGTVTFEYNEKSTEISVQTLMKQIESELKTAKENYYIIDYTSSESKFAEIKAEFEKKDKEYKSHKNAERLAKDMQKLADECNALLECICESKKVEYRGVWLRPTQTSAYQVDEYVETLYKNGINTICIETLYDSCMIMPMPEDSLFTVNPKFRGFDMLASYIESCHKRGMELHIWMPVFYVGNEGDPNVRQSVATKKPEWLSMSSNGKSAEDANGYYLLDPANPEVQDFLLTTYKYILEKYDVDAFHLDYIRYYSNAESNCDWGYSEVAKKGFEEKYGVKPAYNPSAKYWNDWVNYRCDQVTTFVSRVRKLIDEVKPDCLLAADVAPDPKDGIKNIYQDYSKWQDNGWLDLLCPMSYGVGFESAIKSQTDRCGDKAFIAVGLGIFMAEMDPAIMRDQVVYNNSVYTTGSCFFEASAYISKNTGDYLKRSVYREDAIAPNFDKERSFGAYLDTAIERIEKVIVPLEGISDDNAKKVITAINEFKSKGFSADSYKAVSDAVKATEMAENAQKAILNDIGYAAKLYLVADKSIDLSDVPATPGNDNTESNAEEVSDEESVSAAEEGKNSNTAAIIAIVIAVLAVVAAAAVVIKKKK